MRRLRVFRDPKGTIFNCLLFLYRYLENPDDDVSELYARVKI